MVPSSAAMLAPMRPLSASPVSTGPSSRIIVLPTSVPTKYSGMAPVNVYDACSASTMPVKAERKSAMGSELSPSLRICITVSPGHVRRSARARPLSATKRLKWPKADSSPSVIRPTSVKGSVQFMREM
jgi:hypothetical protein